MEEINNYWKILVRWYSERFIYTVPATMLLVALLFVIGIMDPAKSGPIGDTIGGIAGPMLSAFSAVLVYKAFKEQVKANQLIQDHFELEGIFEELDSLEGYADDLETKLYSREIQEDGTWKLAQHDSDSILLRSWAYRIGVAKDMLESARKTKNKAVIDRVESFAADRLNDLLKQLDKRIPKGVDDFSLSAWKDAYEDYLKNYRSIS